MNNHIYKWKTKYDQVQKVIDALPESRDNTAEMKAGDKRSRTLSDNSSQNFEETKNVENPYGDQEFSINNDHTVITANKVN